MALLTVEAFARLVLAWCLCRPWCEPTVFVEFLIRETSGPNPGKLIVLAGEWNRARRRVWVSATTLQGGTHRCLRRLARIQKASLRGCQATGQQNCASQARRVKSKSFSYESTFRLGKKLKRLKRKLTTLLMWGRETPKRSTRRWHCNSRESKKNGS